MNTPNFLGGGRNHNALIFNRLNRYILQIQDKITLDLQEISCCMKYNTMQSV